MWETHANNKKLQRLIMAIPEKVIEGKKEVTVKLQAMWGSTDSGLFDLQLAALV
ncbi:MAG: hypothetical protein M3Z26_06875 [Bacteroidota bacterium]|nr:hypothetical protein [Bacteroidota bacterium]